MERRVISTGTTAQGTLSQSLASNVPQNGASLTQKVVQFPVQGRPEEKKEQKALRQGKVKLEHFKKNDSPTQSKKNKKLTIIEMDRSSPDRPEQKNKTKIAASI